MPVTAFSWNSRLDYLQSIKGLQVGIIHSRARTTGRKLILDCHLQTYIVSHEIQIFKFKLQFFIVSMVCYQEVRWGLIIQSSSSDEACFCYRNSFIWEICIKWVWGNMIIYVRLGLNIQRAAIFHVIYSAVVKNVIFIVKTCNHL